MVIHCTKIVIPWCNGSINPKDFIDDRTWENHPMALGIRRIQLRPQLKKMCPIFRWFTHIKHVYIEYVYTTYNRICIYVCMYINPIRFWAQIISNPHLGGWYPNLAGLSLSQFGYLKYPTKKTKISLLIHWFWWEVGSLSTATCRATLKVMSCP